VTCGASAIRGKNWGCLGGSNGGRLGLKGVSRRSKQHKKEIINKKAEQRVRTNRKRSRDCGGSVKKNPWGMSSGARSAPRLQFMNAEKENRRGRVLSKCEKIALSSWYAERGSAVGKLRAQNKQTVKSEEAVAKRRGCRGKDHPAEGREPSSFCP